MPTIEQKAQERYIAAYQAYFSDPDKITTRNGRQVPKNAEEFKTYIEPYRYYQEGGKTVYYSGNEAGGTWGATDGTPNLIPIFSENPSENYVAAQGIEGLATYRATHPEIDLNTTVSGSSQTTTIDFIAKKMQAGKELSDYEKDFFARAIQQDTGKNIADLSEEEVKSSYQNLVSEGIWNPQPEQKSSGGGLGGLISEATGNLFGDLAGDTLGGFGSMLSDYSKDIGDWTVTHPEQLQNAVNAAIGTTALATAGAGVSTLLAPAEAAGANTALALGGPTALNNNMPPPPGVTDPSTVMADSTGVVDTKPVIQDPTTVVTVPNPGEGAGGPGIDPGSYTVTGLPTTTIPGDPGYTGAPSEFPSGNTNVNVPNVPDINNTNPSGWTDFQKFLATLGITGLGGLADYMGQKESSEAELQAYREGLAQQQAMHESYTQSLTPESRFTPEQLQAQTQWRDMINAQLSQGAGYTGPESLLGQQMAAAKQAELGKMQGEMLGNIGQQRASDVQSMSNTMRGLYGNATPGLQASMGQQINQAYAGPTLQARMMPQYEMQQWKANQANQGLQNLQYYSQAPLGNLPQGYTEPLYPPTDYSQANMWGTLGNMFTTGLMGYMMNNTNPYAM